MVVVSTNGQIVFTPVDVMARIVHSSCVGMSVLGASAVPISVDSGAAQTRSPFACPPKTDTTKLEEIV